MSASIEVAAPGRARSALSAALTHLDVVIAVAGFVVLCIVALRAATFLPEPDDYAYRGSIVAMTDGHFLSLSSAQMRALAASLPGPSLSGPGRLAILQWVQLPNGRWISEKNPGYPFLAAPFQALGIIRWAPLFYGALACLGLFAGARRWLGRYGGAAAVGLYCSSGAALLFAWRDYMPTFTDASLIAAGTGALLWAMLAAEASQARRTWAGLAGFVALEAATFARYTDIVMLGCAVIAVLIAWRVGRLAASALAWWLGSVVVFCAGVAVFDDLVYGGPLRSGYRPGEIRFSLQSIPVNLRYLPQDLIRSMPMLLLGLAALAGIAGRWLWLRSRRAAPTADQQAGARTDLVVGLALGGSWLAIWGLYSAYSWTAVPFLPILPTVRFYVPALGAIALLGAWLATRLPVRALAVTCVVAVAFGLGIWNFHSILAEPHGQGSVVHCAPPGPAKQPVGQPRPRCEGPQPIPGPAG